MFFFWYALFVGLSCYAQSKKVGQINCKVSEFMNSFSFDMHHHLSMENEKENMVFSPYSIYSALAMLSLGANNTSKEQINSALKWEPGVEHWSEISQMRRRIEVEDSNAVDAKLDLANNGWLASGTRILDDYLNDMQDIFGVEFQRENFAQAETARDNINRWVSDHTGQRINELFPRGSLDEMTKLVLANAIYFKGSWRKPFEKKYTTVGDFKRHDGTNSKVNYMFKTSEFLSGVHRNVELLELPYGSDGMFSMLFAKPRDKSDPELYDYQPHPDDFVDILTLCKEMNVDVITGMLESLVETEIDVYVPKFTVKTGFDLIDKLKSLGVDEVFSSEKADLSRITDEVKLYVSSAEHKSFIEVDEEGTKAAGATGFTMNYMSMPPKIRLDRPFLFFILNKPCNSVIFSGKVMDPSL